MDMKLTTLLFLCYLYHVSEAAIRVDAKDRARATIQRRRSALKRSTEEENVSVNELLQLTEGETMEVARTAKTSQGVRVERLQEKYKGIEVFDSSVVVEVDKNGQLTGDATGTLIQGIEEDLPSPEAKITQEEALIIALKTEGDLNIKDSIDPPTVTMLIYLDKSDTARLTYDLRYAVTKNGIPKRPSFLIDAISGEILLHWNNIDTTKCDNHIEGFGGNEVIGKVVYGEMPYCLDMRVEEDVCFLENKYVRVVDMMNSYNETINETVSFPCTEGFNDTINGAYSPALDALFYGTIMGKMFEDWFQSTPLREKVILRVHYGEEFQNAFWNGVNCTFGDGGSYMYPLVSFDVVCHEVGHGVTEQSSNLFYFGQSGGLNEAFSDMLGEACENYFQSNDFFVGQGFIKNENRTFLRSFEHPSVDGFSIEHVNDFTDDMDPHSSSGVFNRAFYVTIKQKGLELRQAIKAFYHANTMYWHHLSTFEDASCGVLKSVYDLGQKPTPYIRAFKDVGIDTCNLITHIRSLANNRTYEDITVSMDSEPLFAFESPVWAEDVYLNAESANGDVGIEYYIGSTNTTMDDLEVAGGVKGNINYVEIQDISSTVVFFTLTSPNGQLLDDVAVTAGYSCNYNFNSTERYIMWYYSWYCFGEW